MKTKYDWESQVICLWFPFYNYQSKCNKGFDLHWKISFKKLQLTIAIEIELCYIDYIKKDN